MGSNKIVTAIITSEYNYKSKTKKSFHLIKCCFFTFYNITYNSFKVLYSLTFEFFFYIRVHS